MGLTDANGEPHIHSAVCLEQDCPLIQVDLEPPARTRAVSRRTLLRGGAALGAISVLGWAVASKHDQPSTAPRDRASLPRRPESVVSPTLAPEPVATSAPVVAAPETDPGIIVPEVLGLDLQTAQEHLRILGLRTRSVDDTGQGRAQIVDRNWRVVRQDAAAGTRARSFQTIVLYVRKPSE